MPSIPYFDEIWSGVLIPFYSDIIIISARAPFADCRGIGSPTWIVDSLAEAGTHRMSGCLAQRSPLERCDVEPIKRADRRRARRLSERHASRALVGPAGDVAGGDGHRVWLVPLDERRAEFGRRPHWTAHPEPESETKAQTHVAAIISSKRSSVRSPFAYRRCMYSSG